MKNYLSQINLYDKGNLKGFGPLGLEQGQSGISVFASFISSAIGLITIIGFIWVVIILITGALGILTSGGDKNALESAKKKITTGIIGLIVLVLALFILNIIAKIMGLSSILDITTLFGLIQIK